MFGLSISEVIALGTLFGALFAGYLATRKNGQDLKREPAIYTSPNDTLVVAIREATEIGKRRLDMERSLCERLESLTKELEESRRLKEFLIRHNPGVPHG